MDRYSTSDLLQVAGLSGTNFRQLVTRGYLTLSNGLPGKGRRPQHDKTDVLQARLLVKLGQVGVQPNRAAKFWPVVASALHHPEGLLLLAPREDGTDTDYRLVLPGGDAGLEHPDAPGVLAVINLRAIKQEVAAKLAALRSAAA